MSSDQGVALYRKLLVENMESIQRGEDPKGIVRDPAKNEPMIKVVRPHERPPVFIPSTACLKDPAARHTEASVLVKRMRRTIYKPTT